MKKIRTSTYETLGEYSLARSDSREGSLFLISDFLEIIGLQDANLVDKSKIKSYANKEYIKSEDANTIWEIIRKKIKNNEIKNVPEYLQKNKNINFVSFDELLIRKLLLMTFPNCRVEMQVPVRNPVTNRDLHVDLKVTYNDVSKIIEFMGPIHFVKMKKVPQNPLERKNMLENISPSTEVIIWPYWIARCEQNVRMIFNQQGNGFGALWSTEYLFGKFYFDNSAQVIQQITERFNAWNNSNGVCDFYQKDSYNRIKPAHPIINDLQKGNTPCEKLLPKGADDHVEKWIPNISTIKL